MLDVSERDGTFCRGVTASEVKCWHRSMASSVVGGDGFTVGRIKRDGTSCR